MTIKEAQELVDRWIREYGVRYFSELTNMTVLTEEVGELARIMARRYGDQSWKAEDPRGADNGKAALGEEMADVLWVLSGESDRRRPHSGARKEHREEDPARRSPPHPQQKINGIESLLLTLK